MAFLVSLLVYSDFFHFSRDWILLHAYLPFFSEYASTTSKFFSFFPCHNREVLNKSGSTAYDTCSVVFRKYNL